MCVYTSAATRNYCQTLLRSCWNAPMAQLSGGGSDSVPRVRTVASSPQAATYDTCMHKANRFLGLHQYFSPKTTIAVPNYTIFYHLKLLARASLFSVSAYELE